MAANVDSILPAKFALRGVIANIEAGLALKFQFNPTTIEYSKSVNYSKESIPGWDHTDIIFESGGEKRIRFDLFFDRTGGAVDSDFAAIGVPLVGTEAMKAVLESFLYPQRDILQFMGKPSLFKAPPRATLLLGTRWYDTVFDGEQALRDTLFDKLLTPVRTFAGINLLVVEEGQADEVNTAIRKGLALANSALVIADVIAEVF